MTELEIDRPALPGSAWAVALLSAVGGVVVIAWRGWSPVDEGVALSMLLSAVVVAWISHGVLRGGLVRTVVALAVLVVTFLAGAGEVGQAPWSGWAWLSLALDAAVLVALLALVRSAYYGWQRRHHDTRGVPLGGVLALAALTGVLGALTADKLVVVDIRFESAVAPSAHDR